MSRISIDVTSEEHQRLKALAALKGKSIKEFVLSSTLGDEGPDLGDGAALSELEALLESRLANARVSGVSQRTIRDIVERVKREVSGSK